MDLIKYTSQTLDPLSGTEIVVGYDSITWTERYRDPGEFKIVAALSSLLGTTLPIGTVITHSGTYELMVVENHLIVDEPKGKTKIEITGRSYEVILSDRVVRGVRSISDTNVSKPDMIMPSDTVMAQIASLITEEITGDASRDLTHITVLADTDGYIPGEMVERKLEKLDLHQQVLNLLAVDRLGIESIRPNPFGVYGNPLTTTFRIYAGFDRTNFVLFSAPKGDFDAVDLLESGKVNKNVAVVTSTYFEITVGNPSVSGPNRKEIAVDASDIDSDFDVEPVGSVRDAVLLLMRARGAEVLSRNNSFVISRTDVSDFTQARYRVEYRLGDIVGIESNYNRMLPMRVTDFTEITDANGTTGHPTFSVITE